MLKYFFGLDSANKSVILAGILLLRSGGWVGWAGVEKLRLKLTLAKVEVEAELGKNNSYILLKNYINRFILESQLLSLGCVVVKIMSRVVVVDRWSPLVMENRGG